MPLWDRFKRLVRSNVGRMRPGSAQPEFDRTLMDARANVRFLGGKVTRLKRREAELEAKVKAAEKLGSEVAAGRLEIDLREAQFELARAQAELELAQETLDRAGGARVAPELSQPASVEEPPAAENLNEAPGEHASPASAAAKTIGPGSSAPVTQGRVADGPLEKSLGPAEETGDEAEDAVGPPEQLLDELERLGRLLEAGALSQEEFSEAKRELLG